ncbi:uncharacterized protein LOC111386524 [Olea europaea var. sylvestris]|uniref:Uncharacterized protein n=1 Tax=Olea europaea subsp. europaea TaxID=158383 RepID=A0A8S0QPA5_OLEEU|nr:uncharacterized protein LOC111386524 [Olea europaea var. sylvestris]CAA2968408.1 Hypothetical predicted protein [Olea europaea subsp. europaea]
MKSKVSGQNSFLRVITIPYRVLCKARDFYVRSITDCSVMANYRPTNMRGLSKSYSVRSSLSSESEDFRELVRASSNRRTDLDLELYLQQQKKVGMPRSSSVAMGSIDEDRPCCYFGEMNVNSKREYKYPRSRSHAVATTSSSLLI